MIKVAISVSIGLMLASPLVAEPLVEGQVRLSSGEAVVAAQVMVFDLTDLQRGPVAQATTDGAGYFALPLGGHALPQGFALGQNYPNPFNPSTVIPYQLPTAAHVRLDVFNVLGQRIETLVNEERPAGVHTVVWDATDAAGQAVAAGVYIYRLSGAGVELTRRMVLVDGQAGMAATVLPVSVGEALGSAVGATSEPAEQTYGIVVSGAGMVPYVDAAFEVRAGMAPVEFVVESVENLPRGKALACGILGDVNNDGQVDLADALLVVVFNLDPSITAPNNGNIGLGDVTDDGTVNLADLLAIMTYVINPLDASLPTGIGQAATRVNWVAGSIRQLTNDDRVAYYASPSWSPDGRYIYFNAWIDGDHAILRVATEADWYGYYDIGELARYTANYAWSPDGRYIAFDYVHDGNRDIYVFDRETETFRRLTENRASDRQPTWSPDGKYIAFSSDRSDNWDIYLIDADGGEDEYLHRLTDIPSWERGALDPAWSPDGKHIAFSQIGIHVMDADGSNVRELNFCGESPAWSPDGKYIAFSDSPICFGTAGGAPDIHIMDADGSNDYTLTNNKVSDGSPAWSPDGRHIAFVSDRDRDGNDDIYVMELLGSCE